jgi:hypothetical protein
MISSTVKNTIYYLLKQVFISAFLLNDYQAYLKLFIDYNYT